MITNLKPYERIFRKFAQINSDKWTKYKISFEIVNKKQFIVMEKQCKWFDYFHPNFVSKLVQLIIIFELNYYQTSEKIYIYKY